MNTKRKAFFKTAVCGLMCILMLLGSIVSVCAENGSNVMPACNIVLLIDKSGSMNATDPNKLAVDAARMFVDSFYSEVLLHNKNESQQDYSSLGVIAFSKETTEISDSVQITSEKDVSYITSQIDNIKYDKVNTGATDLGRAVLAATQMLERNASANRKNLIILFTDGYTDGLSSAGRSHSAAMKQEGIEKANSMGADILVVGLNYQGRINNVGRQEIWAIANQTQTGKGLMLPDTDDPNAADRVNYMITDSREDVSNFYTAVFAELMDSSPVPTPGYQKDGWTYYDVDLTAPGIYCANVYLLSDTQIGDVVLFDPAGSRVSLDDSRIRYARGNGYAIFTIQTPDQGIWSVGAEGVVNYRVSYLSIYGMDLTMDTYTDGNRGYVTVSGSYMDEPLPAEFYQGLTSATCTAVPDFGGAPVITDLVYDESSNKLSCSFEVEQPGVYTVEAVIESNQMTRVLSQSMDFAMAGNRLDISVVANSTKEIPLREAVLPTWNNITMTVDDAVVETDSIASVSFENGTLSVKGLRFGSTEATVYATDNLGQPWTIPCTITVAPNWALLIPIILVLCLLLALAAKILKDRFGKAGSGEFVVTCSLNDAYTSQVTDPPRGTSFSLYKLVMQILDPNSDSSDIRTLAEAVNSESGELKSDKYRIRYVTERFGDQKKKTYRYGPRKAALSGEIYRSEISDLIISVEYQVENYDDEESSDESEWSF